MFFMKNRSAMSVAVCAALVFLTGCAGKQDSAAGGVSPFQTPESEAFVDSLYDAMSVYERAAQLYSIQPQEIMVDGEVSLELCREKMPYGIGHVCQFTSNLDVDADRLREVAKQIQDYLVNESSAHIPAILHEECITGLTAKGATIYPQQIGLACSWNPEMARLKTGLTAIQMRSVGVTMALSPMTDIIRNPSWCRGEESYGEDGYLSAAMASAFVQGLQSEGLHDGVAACTKHFLGYGGGSTLSWKEIMEEVLLPHEVCIRQAGSKAVMTCYDKFRSEQAVTSDTLINVILRDGLGYDGIFVSDYLSIGYKGNDPDSLKLTAALALNTGNDLEFCNGDNYQYLPELLEKGLVSEQAFENAVKRALTMKYNVGLFEEGYGMHERTNLDSDEMRHLSYQLATQSVVLLKNDGVLPLSGTDGSIALVGPNAAAFCAMIGDYTYPSMSYFWHGNEMDPESPHIVSLREGLEDRLDGAELSYSRGCEWSVPGELTLNFGGDPRIKALTTGLIPKNENTDWNEAVKMAAGCDVIIAAMGENPALCGEGRERTGIRLPGQQQEFVSDLIATGKPVVLVIFGGRPQCVSEIADGCAAIIQAWYPGEEGGHAVADILLGNVNPSGRLAITYPNHEIEGQFSYTDAENSDYVAYPFGYGLSYTTFDVTDCEASVTGNEIRIVCDVTNTGDVDGSTVLQLYVSPDSVHPQDMKPIQLKGFSIVGMAPGEQAEVTFILSADQLAECVMPSGAPGKDAYWLVEGGTYLFKLGFSSQDIRRVVPVNIREKNRRISFGGREGLIASATVKM